MRIWVRVGPGLMVDDCTHPCSCKGRTVEAAALAVSPGRKPTREDT